MLHSPDIAIGRSSTLEPAATQRLQRRSRSHTDSTSHSNALPYTEQRPPNSANDAVSRHVPCTSPTSPPPILADSLDAMARDLEQGGGATEKQPPWSWGAQARELRGRAGPAMWAAVKWTFLLLTGQNEPVRNFLIFIGTALGIFLALCTILGSPFLGGRNGAFLPMGGAPAPPPDISNDYHHCTVLTNAKGRQIVVWVDDAVENQIPVTL
ncbi:hypothetical protein V8F20_006083 [Naviculisporaceae sp. PSN 640]